MRLLNNLLTTMFAIGLAMLVNACSEKDLYSPKTDGSDEVPVEGKVPTFALSTNVPLSVNYNIPDYKVNFEIYTENPIEFNEETGVRTKKEGLEAVFSAYTDDNCKFEGKVSIPTATKKVYLYSNYIGIPQCVELSVETSGVSFDSSDMQEQTVTRANGGHKSPDYVGVGEKAYVINSRMQIYSLTEIAENGYLSSKYAPIAKLSKGLLSRINLLLKGNEMGTTGNTKPNNSYLVRDEGITNICVVENSGDKKIESAAIDLKYVSERAGYKNVLGYYYYKTGQKPANVNNLPKYIIFPNVSSEEKWAGDPLRGGMTIRLKFFGENYDEPAQDEFKPGYTIGWFMISDGYDDNKSEIKVNNQTLYSNASWNKDGKSRCIAAYDKISGITVVGFEDGIGDNHDSSYEDALFYIESSPSYAIEKPDDRPDVPDPEPLPDATETTYGTLTFEDEWPGEGDYDMNDAAIKYSSSVTYDSDNKVVKLVATFTPVQASNAAIYNNAFGFQLLGCSSADFTVEGATLENGQNYPTFIVFNNLNAEKDAKTVTLNFKKGQVNKEDVDFSKYNPFIVAKADRDVQLGQGRNEVHLPTYAPTKLGKEISKNQWESYYVSETTEDGIRFPFAINIPGNQEFKLALERVRVDLAYGKFKSWVKKGCGTEDADWYLYPNADKVQ